MQLNTKKKHKYKNFSPLMLSASPVSIMAFYKPGFTKADKITFCFSLTRDIFFDAGFQQPCFPHTGLKHFNHFSCNVCSILYS